MYDEKYLEEVARVVIQILKKEGAIRLADNVNPDGVYLKDLLAMLEDKGHHIGQSTYYNKIKSLCERMGYGITTAGKGQFIGRTGESIARNLNRYRNQVVGRTVNMKKNLIAAGEARTIDEGNEYSRVHFGMNLVDAANVCKAVGKEVGDPYLQFPRELETYLLEASKK